MCDRNAAKLDHPGKLPAQIISPLSWPSASMMGSISCPTLSKSDTSSFPFGVRMTMLRSRRISTSSMGCSDRRRIEAISSNGHDHATVDLVGAHPVEDVVDV